jgi:hypothetical protein
MKKVLLLSMLSLFCLTCKKESTCCWEIYDAAGLALKQVCGKTESEIQSEYPGVLVDRTDAPKFCWKVMTSSGDTTYTTAITENFFTYFYTKIGAIGSKIDCSTCQSWFIREKDLIKSTGGYYYGIQNSVYLCGDKTSTLFAGRMILIKETADTTYYTEFVQKQ